MTSSTNSNTVTVSEAAERIGVSTEWVRRHIKSGDLFAVRVGTGRTAPWMLHESDVAHVAELEAHRRRVRDVGIVVGRGGDFRRQIEASDRYDAATKDEILDVHDGQDRYELLDRLAGEIRIDPELARRFEELDEDEHVEAAAQELARRTRIEERIRARAREILDGGTT